MMHFIYGGTLDFPEKANVGYVLLLGKFKHKNCVCSALLNDFAKSQ